MLLAYQAVGSALSASTVFGSAAVSDFPWLPPEHLPRAGDIELTVVVGRLDHPRAYEGIFPAQTRAAKESVMPQYCLKIASLLDEH